MRMNVHPIPNVPERINDVRMLTGADREQGDLAEREYALGLAC
jgi:hypothetical protein